MICFFFEEARSTSLPTCEEPIDSPDSTSTSARVSLIARTMASAYCAPAGTSRGAIQQLRPRASKYAVSASARARSAEA